MQRIIETWTERIFPSDSTITSTFFNSQTERFDGIKDSDGGNNCDWFEDPCDESVGDPDDPEEDGINTAVIWEDNEDDPFFEVKKPLLFNPKLPPWKRPDKEEEAHSRNGLKWIKLRDEMWSMSIEERKVLLEHWLDLEVGPIDIKILPLLEGYRVASRSVEMANRLRHQSIMKATNLIMCTISGNSHGFT